MTYSPNAALLIDFDNVTMGIRSDLQSELRNLLSSDIIKGKVQLRRAYADWRRYPQYVAPLAESSIDMIMAPAYGSSKKNATDIRLAIDALELVFTRPEIGTYILLSGDSDFSTLVIKLKEYGKYVIGVGIRESSSDLLVMNCDEYYSYNALAGLVRTGSDDAAGRRDPWELVSEAIARMQRNGDVMRADRLKQVMQDIDSTFDEKNLGMSKFSRFVTEAAGRGLLSVTKLDTGQLEVSPPRARGAADAPVRIAEPAREGIAEVAGEAPGAVAEGAAGGAAGTEERSRGRRGGRGGRGRDRDRDRDRERPASGSGAAVGSGAAATAGAAHAEPVVVPVAAPVGDGIGVGGERLTRDEAFTLVRNAVQAVATDDRAARASDVRAKARALLGRDSASLSQENFARILRDAHDADVIDLRRRGDDFEVAPAAVAAPVADQLNLAAAAARPAAGAPSSGAAPAPRGMGPRGVGGRARSAFGARVGSPPPDLLSIGVVDIPGASAANAPGLTHAADAAHAAGAGHAATTHAVGTGHAGTAHAGTAHAGTAHAGTAHAGSAAGGGHAAAGHAAAGHAASGHAASGRAGTARDEAATNDAAAPPKARGTRAPRKGPVRAKRAAAAPKAVAETAPEAKPRRPRARKTAPRSSES